MVRPIKKEIFEKEESKYKQKTIDKVIIYLFQNYYGKKFFSEFLQFKIQDVENEQFKELQSKVDKNNIII